MTDEQISERQQREIDYHRDFARQHRDVVDRGLALELLTSTERRWWNAYWSSYDMLLAHDLRGKRVLVPGCGFGDDALLIAHLGAETYAFDISPDVLEITAERAHRLGYENVDLRVMAAEAMDYPADYFDAVYCRDILHHTDIPRACAELRRVSKPGGRFVGSELYTHSLLQAWVRKNPLIDKVLYPRMVRLIYGTDKPYITEDEHKIDQAELDHILAIMTDCRVVWFNLIVGRLTSSGHPRIARLDRRLLRLLGGAGRLVAGRLIWDGAIRK